MKLYDGHRICDDNMPHQLKCNIVMGYWNAKVGVQQEFSNSVAKDMGMVTSNVLDKDSWSFAGQQYSSHHQTLFYKDIIEQFQGILFITECMYYKIMLNHEISKQCKAGQTICRYRPV